MPYLPAMNRMRKDVSTALVPIPDTAFSPDFDDLLVRSRIFTVCGVQVMFDRDLAELYGVPTKRPNEQVKRNAERFPLSFTRPMKRQRAERSSAIWQ